MTRVRLLLMGFVFACVPCKSQTLDSYGGLTNVKCQKATGWFHAEKTNDRWWLCTPLGHAYFFEGVAAFQIPTLPKYNNSPNAAAAALLNEVQSWKFNGVGELSDRLAEPIGECRGCAKLPAIQTLLVSNYAAVNLWNYARGPMKNLIWGLNTNYRGWRASVMDFFEPQFGTWLTGYFTHDSGFLAYKSSPYFVGMMLDDTDWFWGMGAGPDFHTVPEGHTNSHIGYVVLITSPVQTFNIDPASRGVSEVYSDTQVHSKTAMAHPPADCSIQTPCSLRDYLFKKYGGSIAALNAAWGSNYTTFDSSGTQVAGEEVGTGDGLKTVFTATLAHTPVSPESVLIKLDGKIQGGDCPWFNRCNVSTAATGSIMGATGAALISGAQPWLSDFTSEECGTCGLPPASYWVRTTYHMKAGFFSSPSREVGNTYQTGHRRIVVSPPALEPNATGWDIYVSCANLSKPLVSWCGPMGTYGDGKETLQSSNIPFNQKWTEPATGLAPNGSSVPEPPSFINYSNGQVTVTFSAPVPKGRKITVSYISGGWMYGTGLMDEDGRHTAWVGTNAVCLSPATACDGHDFPKPTANARLAADLDGWVSQFSAEYFGTLSKHLRAAAPHMLYFGADTVGTWGAPPRKEILTGAAPYVDGLLTLWFGDQPDPSTGMKQYQYLTRYFGDKPIMNFMTLHAQPDSAMSEFRESQCCFGSTSQAARGRQWETIVSSMLNTPGYNGTYQWVGIAWWGLYDFGNERIDWGLKTPSDNAYDGHEAVKAQVPCSPPLERLNCGGEKKDYGDVITPVKRANQAWIEKAENGPGKSSKAK